MKISLSCFARICAATAFLFCGAAAFAQNSEPTVSQPPASPPSTASAGAGSWGNEKFERQEFREEMEQIRKQHEDLEQAQDRLLDTCLNAAGAKAEQCQQQRQDLRDQKQALHERLVALHAKMDAARSQHQQEGNLWPQHGPGLTATIPVAPSVPPQTPPGN